MKTAQKHLTKIIFFLALIAITGAFFLNYMYRQEVERSRAEIPPGETLQLNFVPDRVNAPQGQTFTTEIQLFPTQTFQAVNYDFNILYDSTKLEVVSVMYSSCRNPQGTPVPGSPDAPAPTRLHLTYTYPADCLMEEGVSATLAYITFRSLSNAQSMTTMDYTVPHYFTQRNPDQTTSQVETIMGDLVVNPDPTATPGGPTATPSPQPTCDPNIEAVAPCTGSPTPSPTQGNTTLNLKVKLQGITASPRTNTPMNMRVTVRGGSQGLNSSGYASFTAGNDGIWSGVYRFDMAADPNLNARYSVYIKPPLHLQKRICVNSPTETAGGTYHCATNQMTITAGQTNNLNFSGIILLAGDLPITNGQQNGLIDSEDTSYIRNNFGKTDSDILARADLNRDGNLDTQDFALVIAALSIKYDDLVEGTGGLLD